MKKRIKSRPPIKKHSATTLPVKDKKPSKQLEEHQPISRHAPVQPYTNYRERKFEKEFQTHAQVDRMFYKLAPLMQAVRKHDRLVEKHVKHSSKLFWNQ